MTFTREVWGQRTFDLNTDGLANYGLYADWLQQVRQTGPAIAHDMFQGAEAYLEMWERAYGVRATACVRRGSRVRRRESFKSVLYGLGQPASRSARAYTYAVCGSHRRFRVTFSRHGTVARAARA